MYVGAVISYSVGAAMVVAEVVRPWLVRGVRLWLVRGVKLRLVKVVRLWLMRVVRLGLLREVVTAGRGVLILGF